jgi:hypothetical protein
MVRINIEEVGKAAGGSEKKALRRALTDAPFDDMKA